MQAPLQTLKPGLQTKPQQSFYDLVVIGEAERTASRTWIVYTLPARLRSALPELFAHLSGPQYRTARVFSATVGGGEIHILRHDSTPGHD